MTDTFIPVKDLEWTTVKINRYEQEGPLENHKWRYELELFEPYASWDALSSWEVERFESMQEHIKQDDCLWEVGAEMGLFPAIFSKYMTSNLILFEPTQEFWPGIKAIFERNKLKDPTGSYAGFLSNKTSKHGFVVPGWPNAANKNKAIEKRKYRNVYDPDDRKTVTSIEGDQIPKNYAPDHVSVDVEGAELLVLQGMREVLKQKKPLLWVSVHKDLIQRDYNATAEDVYFFLDDCGYDLEILAEDHETHVFARPK